MIWSYAYTPRVWLQVITVLLLIALAVYSFRRHSVPAAPPFPFALLFGVLGMVGISLEVAAVDASTVEVYFGPEPPVGRESNWIQTIPGKGW